MVGVLIGYGQLIAFYRWFIRSLFAGLLGSYFGFDKGLNVSDEELTDLEDDNNETNRNQ